MKIPLFTYLSYRILVAAATHKYIWIKDLTNNTDKTLWKTKGMDIQIGEVVPEKGITVTIDGNTKYINTAGVISQ